MTAVRPVDSNSLEICWPCSIKYAREFKKHPGHMLHLRGLVRLREKAPEAQFFQAPPTTPCPSYSQCSAHRGGASSMQEDQGSHFSGSWGLTSCFNTQMGQDRLPGGFQPNLKNLSVCHRAGEASVIHRPNLDPCFRGGRWKWLEFRLKSEKPVCLREAHPAQLWVRAKGRHFAEGCIFRAFLLWVS
jgi:hypothetical protein